MQIPRALYFGPKTCLPPVVGHVLEHTIPQDHCHLYYALDGRQFPRTLVHDGVERSCVCDIALERPDTRHRKLVDERLCLGRLTARPRKKCNVSRTATHELTCETATETAQPANEEVCGIGVESEGVLSFVQDRGGDIVAEREHHFSTVLALLDRAEGITYFSHGQYRERTGSSERGLADELECVLQNVSEVFGVFFKQAEGIQESKRRTLGEWAHVQVRIVENIAQANFDKGTERSKAFPRSLEKLAREGIDYAAHPAASSHAYDALGEAGIARVEDTLVGDLVRIRKERALFWRTGRSVYSQPQVLSDLNSCLTHSPRGGVDEDCLPFAQSTEVHQCVVRRDEDNRQGCCRFEGGVIRDLDGQAVVGSASGRVGS